MPLKVMRLAILVGDDYEDQELWYPKYRLIEAGATVVMAGQQADYTYRSKHGYPATSDASIAKLKAKDFQGVVIPGGWMPDRLRRDPKVLAFVRDLAGHDKLVAAEHCIRDRVADFVGMTFGNRLRSEEITCHELPRS